MQAITTKYFGPTNTRGSRIKATCQARSVTIPYDHALNLDQNHDAAAKALIEKLGWGGKWVTGMLPNGDGAYVCVAVNAAVEISDTKP